MALRLSAPDKIPKGAVIIDEDDALAYQWEQIRSWPSIREVWPFRLGIPVIALAGSVAGLTINAHFRRKLKLITYGKLATSLIMGLMPAAVVTGTHCVLITHEIFLRRSECLLCLQQRAVALQIGASMAWPLLLSPVANMMFASRHGTYRLPYWSDWRGTTNLWWRFVKAGKEKFIGLAVFQAFIVAYMVYKEKQCILELEMKTLALDEVLAKETEIHSHPIGVRVTPFKAPRS